MVGSLAMRGPDGAGVERVAPECVLGHSRLAIVDLSDAGAQPMHDGSGRVWGVVNGEIFNHRALRRELERQGARFRSNCDSEVVVHGYAVWGDAVIDRLQGIFALAVYDTASGQLLLARDRAGVKPLYYALDDRRLIFASELKAIRASGGPRLEYLPASMHVFLAHRFLPAPLTPFRNVFKLPPGHKLQWSTDGYALQRYWTPTVQAFAGTADQACERLSETLKQAVSAQLMADTPVGLMLSGGIDSSSVATLATSHGRAIEAFCCGFEQSTHDERCYARAAAEFAGVRLHETVMSWPRLKACLPAFIEWFDEPFFNYSAVAIHELSRMARQRGIKVLLAGEGADEIFAGYLWYDDFAAHVHRSDLDPLERFFGYYGLFTGTMQDRLAGRPIGFDHLEILRGIDRPELEPVNRAQWLDFHTFLPDDVLCRDDRASMAAGVELRVPYLDERLLDDFFLLPQSLTYRGGERKHLLKRALADSLPPSILTHRKKGFGFPFYAWETPIRELAAAVLDDGLLVAWGHASPEGIRQVLTEYTIDFVWLLITAELWMRRYLAGEDIATLIGDTTHARE